VVAEAQLFCERSPLAWRLGGLAGHSSTVGARPDRGTSAFA
jgi:hypothetical protein